MNALARCICFICCILFSGCVNEVHSNVDGEPRNPAVAAEVFILSNMASGQLNGDLRENQELRNVISSDLWSLIQRYEKAKRGLVQYPNPGWTERSEELFRVFSRGSPLTGFLIWQRLDILVFDLMEPMNGLVRAKCVLKVSDSLGSRSSQCEFTFVKNRRGVWVVSDFISEGSTAKLRLMEALESIGGS